MKDDESKETKPDSEVAEGEKVPARLTKMPKSAIQRRLTKK